MASAEGGYRRWRHRFGLQMGAAAPQANVALINSGEIAVGAQMLAVGDAETGSAGATASPMAR